MFNEVHRIGSGFLKDPWYQTFRHGPGGIHDIFSMIDPKQHAERRKLFAPLWTNSALHGHWEAMVQKKVELAVSRIKRDALQEEADIFKWWTFMTTDVISHLAFGESTNMLERESVSKPQSRLSGNNCGCLPKLIRVAQSIYRGLRASSQAGRYPRRISLPGPITQGPAISCYSKPCPCQHQDP